MPELVKTKTTLPDRVQVDRQLAELALAGDGAQLLEISQQAAAYQEYEKRNQAKGRADEFGRVKILAEAHIGIIDLRDNPRPRDGVLAFDGREIPGVTRSKWRLLGTALQLDQLDQTIADVGRDPEISVTTHTVVQELRVKGIAWVDPKPLRKRMLELRKEGVRAIDIAERMGIHRQRLHVYLGPKVKRLNYAYALRLALILGVDPATLKPSRSTHAPHKQRRRLPVQRKLTGGRLDQTYTLVRKALQELDAAAGENGRWGTGEAYEHLYEAERIIGTAMKRAHA